MSRIYPYAGFWRRALALMIDSLILSIPAILIYALIMLSVTLGLASHQDAIRQSGEAGLAGILAVTGGMFFFQVAFFVLFWLYFAFMESGKKQATFGKRVMGIKVVGTDGGRISFARATGRFFGKYVSGLILNFGYCMAGFTQKRQALHDLMADTYVVQEDFQQGQEKPLLNFSSGGLVASIIVALAPFIFFFLGLFLAFLIPAVADSNPSEDGINSFKQMKMQIKETMAEADMLLFELNGDSDLPKTENDISYSKVKNGYRAEFTANDGGHFVLYYKKGSSSTCCAEGDCELLEAKKCD